MGPLKEKGFLSLHRNLPASIEKNPKFSHEGGMGKPEVKMERTLTTMAGTGLVDKDNDS